MPGRSRGANGDRFLNNRVLYAQCLPRGLRGVFRRNHSRQVASRHAIVAGGLAALSDTLAASACASGQDSPHEPDTPRSPRDVGRRHEPATPPGSPRDAGRQHEPATPPGSPRDAGRQHEPDTPPRSPRDAGRRKLPFAPETTSVVVQVAEPALPEAAPLAEPAHALPVAAPATAAVPFSPSLPAAGLLRASPPHSPHFPRASTAPGDPRRGRYEFPTIRRNRRPRAQQEVLGETEPRAATAPQWGISATPLEPKPPSRECRSYFRKFVRGYAQGRRGLASEQEIAQGSTYAELQSSSDGEDGEPFSLRPSRSPKVSELLKRSRSPGRDHYELFAEVPNTDVCADDEGRLMGIRIRRDNVVNGRKILASMQRSQNMARRKDMQRMSSVMSGCDQKSNVADLKFERRTREACESLRILVLGPYGNRIARDGGAWYEQRCGTKDEIRELHTIWKQMDEDGSGDVELQEFLNFFDRKKEDRLLGMRCVNYLSSKAKDQGAEDTGCTVEDMMALLYLKAGEDDIDKMTKMFREVEYEYERVPTPPLLPKSKRRQILENFQRPEGNLLGSKGFADSATVSFSDILDMNILDRLTLEDLFAFHGLTPSSLLQTFDILEMFCPYGYRAHKNVKTAIDRDGHRIKRIDNKFFSGWVRADGDSKFAD